MYVLAFSGTFYLTIYVAMSIHITVADNWSL
jgi:hypothetical protein